MVLTVGYSSRREDRYSLTANLEASPTPELIGRFDPQSAVPFRRNRSARPIMVVPKTDRAG